MVYDTRFPGRNSLILLLCIVSLGLAACVQVGGDVKKKMPPLVYPQPPDAPRFYYDWSIYGSASIEPLDREQKLQLLLLGSTNSNNEGFRKPYSVAVNHGRVFVSDSIAKLVRVYDAPSRTYFTIGSAEEENVEARLAKPMGLDTDGAGNLYVIDATERVVKVYSADGKFLRKMLDPADIDRPASVTVEKSGERMYVVDIGGPLSQNHRVRVYNAQTGAHLFDFGKRGDGPGEFNLPRDVAINSGNGELYVVDGGNFRIQVFDRNGTFLRTFGSIGKQLGNFSRPKEIAIDPAGNIYVVDAGFGNFQIFNPQGQLLMFIGQRSNQDGPGLFSLPAGIAVDEDGRVYVVDQSFKKIDIFRPAALGVSDGYLVKGKAIQSR
ncbi:MAG: 6-bladed beta-propeller [Pseudomonadota bacterium]